MKGIKSFLKSIDVAFSIYSKIPMPRFEWDSKDMKYHMCFFPWIGAVIGILLYAWRESAVYLVIGENLFILLAAAIPLIVTGGFHLDGYMDTMDALHSYQEREKKLEILKDPHIGAFSVITVIIYGLLYIGFMSEIKDKRAFGVICCIYFLSRCLSGISVMTFKSAKNNGMLNVFSDTAAKKTVIVSLLGQIILIIAVMFYLSVIYAVGAICAEIVVFIYYKYMSAKQFGGTTGDIAGFFVCVAELAAIIAVSLINILV